MQNDTRFRTIVGRITISIKKKSINFAYFEARDISNHKNVVEKLEDSYNTSMAINSTYASH